MKFMLCSEEEGGEHFPVLATPEQLSMCGLYPIDCEYDDGVGTWQGPLESVMNAARIYGRVQQADGEKGECK